MVLEKWAFVATLGGMTLAATGGTPVGLNWASGVTSGSNPPIAPQNALGAPDGFISFFVGTDSAAYAGFGEGEVTQRGDLADLLGIDQATLDSADFVIFECGISPDGMFEGATFVFVTPGGTDVKNTAAAVASGVIDLGAYEDFFGVPTAVCSGEWAFALFDTTVDTSDPDLAVQIIAGPGQPAPDAMATLSKPPPPPPACPADLDQSGSIDSADLNTLLADFGCTGDECAADIDADGDTDSADLNGLLAAFGQACPR